MEQELARLRQQINEEQRLREEAEAGSEHSRPQNFSSISQIVTSLSTHPLSLQTKALQLRKYNISYQQAVL